MSKLKELCSYTELMGRYDATRMFARRSPTPGIDGVAFSAFDRSAGKQLRELSSELLSKKYVHSNLRPFPIPKNGGGTRWICVPTHRDRLVQRVIQNVSVDLYYDALDTGISFGSFKRRPEISEQNATILACRIKSDYPHVIKSDISSFFDKIPRSIARNEIRRVVRHSSLWWLFDQFLSAEIQCDSSTRNELERAGIQWGLGIRQGMPLSPLMAHIVLRDFDRFAARLDAKILRYVDDILILAKTAKKAESAFNKCKSWLYEKRDGLNLPEIGQGKTLQYGPREAFDFLGLSIYQRNSGVWARKIPSGTYEEIRTRICAKVPDDLSAASPRAVTKAVNYISSLSEGYEAAYRGVDGWRELERRIFELENYAIKRFAKSISHFGRGPVTAQARQAFGLKGRPLR